MVGKDLQIFYPKKYEYKAFGILDNLTTIILRVFTEAFVFIEKAMKKGGKVLVHCMAGKSRSPTIIIGYVMLKNRLRAEEAIKYIRLKHRFTFPNPNFIYQIVEFEKCLELYFK